MFVKKQFNFFAEIFYKIKNRHASHLWIKMLINRLISLLLYPNDYCLLSFALNIRKNSNFCCSRSRKISLNSNDKIFTTCCFSKIFYIVRNQGNLGHLKQFLWNSQGTGFVQYIFSYYILTFKVRMEIMDGRFAFSS